MSDQPKARKGWIRRHLRGIPLREWMWFNFIFWLGVGWAQAMFFFPPTSIYTALPENFVPIWTIITFIGAVLSMSGIIMAGQVCRKTMARGHVLQFVGIFLLAGGPFQYFMVQTGKVFDGDFVNRYTLSYFAWAMLCAVAIRAAEVVPRFVQAVREGGVR